MPKVKAVPITDSELRDAKAWALSANTKNDGRGKSVKAGLKQIRELLK